MTDKTARDEFTKEVHDCLVGNAGQEYRDEVIEHLTTSRRNSAIAKECFELLVEEEEEPMINEVLDVLKKLQNLRQQFPNKK